MTLSTLNIGQKLDREISLLLKHSSAVKMDFPVFRDLTYDDFLSDKMLIISAIRTGIPYSLFDLIRQESPFSENEWAEFIGLSFKSLQNYRQTSKSFKSVQSEKILQIAEVTKTGLEVFEDMDKFKLWLNTPSDSLGDLRPRELIKYSYGKEQLISELTRISEGTWA